MTYSLAIHGGAGTILKSSMTPEKEASYHAGLAKALEAGETILKAGGSAMDAVVAAVCALEDDPQFNAGRGSVFTAEGKQEMDAAVMDGKDRSAGTVAGIFGPRNPVKAARAVMENTSHVTLIGPNALQVAKDAGLEFETSDYFFTQQRWDSLQETLEMRARGEQSTDPARRHGTVGAVALDEHGNLAAATSTGGMTAKAAGRVGDSPIIGAGTYADNDTCAVSGTGHGEVFIRWTAASDIAARMRYAGQSLEEAADVVVMKNLAENDGSGGVVAVDAKGNISMPFNCEGMYRGSVKKGEEPFTAIYR
ncbi:isoaspartyl peptidase/L-asparaginase [Rhodobacteraceae bacterium RKSG542]|uniref:isoaspartyl peptidase/L-asparaginase family protein n=1 Tax=Pseudovibrio flavus TaxID=2529854 RepID=UPI0012BC0D80|nr:isoaspartyl peptidase/L-asparaginase [Pseudovibrio flavus]MTI17972.1 isoaspartyl peptidase/L-asparaginase [Pseudovibrio flavus]